MIHMLRQCELASGLLRPCRDGNPGASLDSMRSRAVAELKMDASLRNRRRKAHCKGEARREASTANGGGWEQEELRKLDRDSGGHRAGGVCHISHIPGMSM